MKNRQIISIDISKYNQELCIETINKLKKDQKYALFFKNKDINLIKKRKYGKYIKFNFKNKLFYISFSENKNKGRNTFLLQGFIKSYHDFVNEKFKRKHFKILLLTIVSNKFNHYVLKMIKTLKIEILNYKEYESITKQKLIAFKSINEINCFKNSLQKNNNYATKIISIEEEENNCLIYARLDGTNLNDVYLIILVLKMLKFNINIIQIYKTKFIKNVKFSFLNVNYHENYKIKLNQDNFITSEKINSIGRNQSSLIYNLLSIFGFKYCYICKSNLSVILDACHIYPFAQIKNNLELSNLEKKKMNIDPYNAFFLCKNHHKLFDCNYIVIKNKKFVLSNSTNFKNNKWLQSNFVETKIRNYDKYQKYIELRNFWYLKK